MPSEMEFHSEILDYYSSKWDEDARLRWGLGRIELIRTQEIVQRILLDASLIVRTVSLVTSRNVTRGVESVMAQLSQP